MHVTDTGVGMSKDVRSKAFEPFFTTKEIGKGSGLGLSQVLGFAKQSGGGVRICSDPGQGTTIEIFLPRADVRPVKTEILQVPRGAMLKASARLILVDDDNAVGEVTAATLRELGYTVLEAGSGGAALELLAQSANVDLMLIDFAMPGMSGAEVARRVQTTRPTLPILFVTGYADRAALEGVSEAQIIGKPFVDSELHEQVRPPWPGGRQAGSCACGRAEPGRRVRPSGRRHPSHRGKTAGGKTKEAKATGGKG